MLSGLQRHFSVVSLLLLAGAGLIILEGPVGPSYFRQLLAPKAAEKQDPKSVDNRSTPESDKQASNEAALAIHSNSANSTWANRLDDAAPLHSTVLGEIPVNEKADLSTASK